LLGAGDGSFGFHPLLFLKEKKEKKEEGKW